MEKVSGQVPERVSPKTRAASAARELWVFLAATFAVSWGVGVAGSVLLGPATYLVGVFGPAIAALWVTRRYEGSTRSLWAHVVRWRLPLRWYAAALAVPLVIIAAGFGLVWALGGAWDVDDALTPLAAVAFLVFAFLVAGGPEELGWRGYALPRLQSRWNALVASLVLGGIWALWHAPLWLMPDLAFAELSYPLYAAQATAMCVVYTWLYNTSRGSVLLAMILHASGNLASLYLAPAVGPQLAVTGLWAAAAVGMVARYGPERLSRCPRVDREAVRRLAGVA